MQMGTVRKMRMALALGAALLLACACLLVRPAFADATDSSVEGAQAAQKGSALALTVNAQEASNALQVQADSASKITYRVRMLSGGWQSVCADYAVAGKAEDNQRITALRISLPKGMDGGVVYSVRRSDGTWSDWKADGAVAGTFRDIEAVRVKLTGSIAAKYDVVYRVNLDDVGWQKRVRNGMVAGTSGKGKAIRAIRMTLVRKSARSGWVGSGRTWRYYVKGKPVANRWVITSESPINKLVGSAAGRKRYWIGADELLAVRRVVDPSTPNDSNAGYAAYASRWGYPVAGKYRTDEGYVFATSSGKLYKTDRWLVRKTASGTAFRYRLKNIGTYAVARTGMFKVDGKKYYAWPSTGRIMCSKSWWLVNAWYTADSKGVLTKSNDKKLQHIERYVKWALKTAADDSHGYSQINRWGPDYDCSSFIVSALWNTGFRTGDASYTGNMIDELTKYGFRWYPNESIDMSKLRRGDILLRYTSDGHTEMYIGNGQVVGAAHSENGGIDGEPGDQTGWEIRTRDYYNWWEGFLRYVG